MKRTLTKSEIKILRPPLSDDAFMIFSSALCKKQSYVQSATVSLGSHQRNTDKAFPQNLSSLLHVLLLHSLPNLLVSLVTFAQIILRLDHVDKYSCTQ